MPQPQLALRAPSRALPWTLAGVSALSLLIGCTSSDDSIGGTGPGASASVSLASTWTSSRSRP